MLKNEKNDKMREEEKKKAEEIMSLNVNMKEKNRPVEKKLNRLK